MRNLVRRISSRSACGAAAALLIGVGGIAQAQVIDIGDVSGAAGSTVQIPVSWDNGSADDASGLTVDIAFAAANSIDPTSATPPKPNCTLAENVRAVKTASGFSYRPPQCTVGDTCTIARAGIIDFGDFNATPVPEGQIYTCSFTIPAGASPTDTFEFTIMNASYIIPDGTETDVTDGSSGGTVSVSTEPTATSTPEETATPEPTNTSPLPTATNTKVPSTGNDEDDGCQVVAPANSSAAWLLMIPAAVLLWQRRRSR